MKRITHKLSMILIPILMLLPATTLVMPAYAACNPSDAAQQVSNGVGQTTTGSPDTSCGQNGVTKAVSLAVNILSLVVGIAAVIAIILAGFKYITSAGESGKVGNAKSTLIYALIGLAIAALAQVLVHFVIFNSASTELCPTNPNPAKPNVPITDPTCKTSP
jgi:hypothetical protein